MLLTKPLLCVVILLLAGCASAPQSCVVLNQRVEVPPLPSSLQKREPNLTRRLVQTLSPSPATVTTPSVTSTPASTGTTTSGGK